MFIGELWICGVKCQIERGAYGDRSISAPNHKVGRLVNGKHCGCTVAWMSENGNCPCAINDGSNPIMISKKEPHS